MKARRGLNMEKFIVECLKRIQQSCMKKYKSNDGSKKVGRQIRDDRIHYWG
jgi:hypothetical protein